MKARHLIAAAAALAASCLPAAAQQLKPGLWEITNRMQSNSGQMESAMGKMQQQMASMSPEQRQMVEQMMAQRGVQMGGGGGAGGMSMKVCMSREMVERNEVPTQRGECKTTSQQRSGNTMKMAFTCANPPSNGEGQVTFNSPETYSMKMTVNTAVQGRAETVNMDGSGKWLGADCGSLRPIGAKP